MKMTKKEINSQVRRIEEDVVRMRKHKANIVKANLCVSCKGTASFFRDPTSRKEYLISGLCQRCQDKLFKSGGI